MPNISSPEGSAFDSNNESISVDLGTINNDVDIIDASLDNLDGRVDSTLERGYSMENSQEDATYLTTELGFSDANDAINGALDIQDSIIDNTIDNHENELAASHDDYDDDDDDDDF